MEGEGWENFLEKRGASDKLMEGERSRNRGGNGKNKEEEGSRRMKRKIK